MSNSKQNIESIIEQIIAEIKNAKITEEVHMHERYVHHRFSYLAQKAGCNISFENKTSKFHPEWATAITGVRKGGYYKGTKDGYKPRSQKKEEMGDNEGGSPGFIDFATGDFDKPDYAIEFKMAKEMDKKGFAFDYMKLLDNRNKFQKAISLSVVFGRKTLITKNQLDKNLFDAIETLQEQDYYDKNKPFRFIVIQLIDGTCHIWECNDAEKGFQQ